MLPKTLANSIKDLKSSDRVMIACSTCQTKTNQFPSSVPMSITMTLTKAIASGKLSTKSTMNLTQDALATMKALLVPVTLRVNLE